jgi:curved DNA-binding protein CbpA
MPEPRDPYKVLQVDPEADPDVVQAAYRRLAQKFHPDRASGPEAAVRMTEINRAWEMIGDPARRAAHDAERRAHADVASVLGGSAPGSRRSTAGPTHRSAPSGPGSPAGGAPGSAMPGGIPGAGAARMDGARGGPSTAGSVPGAAGSGGGTRPADEVSGDWSSGRSTYGSGYDPSSMRTADGEGAAGPPPGNASGSVLGFGRYAGWSLGEVARVDLEYLEWLDRMAIGRAFRPEIDGILRRLGRRVTTPRPEGRRGLFRRG